MQPASPAQTPDQAHDPRAERPAGQPPTPRQPRRPTYRVRQGDLPAPQRSRADHQPAQELPSRRHALRQTGVRLPRNGHRGGDPPMAPSGVKCPGSEVLGTRVDTSRCYGARPPRSCPCWSVLRTGRCSAFPVWVCGSRRSDQQRRAAQPARHCLRLSGQRSVRSRKIIFRGSRFPGSHQLRSFTAVVLQW